MRYSTKKFKDLSKKEFTKAAERYEWKNAGVYKICRADYPNILAEIKKEDFNDLLDVWCWTGPILSLLTQEFPDKHYVWLDLTPKMIEVAKKKKLKNVEFIVWDAEDLPFKENSFDIVICSQSFHHYPNPQKFLIVYPKFWDLEVNLFWEICIYENYYHILLIILNYLF